MDKKKMSVKDYQDRRYQKALKGLTVCSKKGIIISIITAGLIVGGSVGAATYFGLTRGNGGIAGTDAYLSIVDKAPGHWIGETLNPTDFEVKRIDNKGKETSVSSNDLSLSIDKFETAGLNRVVLTDKNTRAIGCININVLNKGEVNFDIFRNAILELDNKEYIDNVEIYSHDGSDFILQNNDTHYCKVDKDYYVRRFSNNGDIEKESGMVLLPGNSKYNAVHFTTNASEEKYKQPASYCSLDEGTFDHKSQYGNGGAYEYIMMASNKFYDAKFEDSKYNLTFETTDADPHRLECEIKFENSNITSFSVVDISVTYEIISFKHVHTFNYDNFDFPIEYKEQNFTRINGNVIKGRTGSIEIKAFNNDEEVTNPLNKENIKYHAVSDPYYEGEIIYRDDQVKFVIDPSNPFNATYEILDESLTNNVYIGCRLLNTSYVSEDVTQD